MLSRSKVAKYASDALIDGSVTREILVTQLAAWLKESHNSRQASYLIEDIAKKLVESGYIFVTITTATTMSEKTRKQVIAFLQNYYGSAATFELREEVQPKVIGGIRIDTPNGSLDATVKRTLIQIVKGVQK